MVLLSIEMAMEFLFEILELDWMCMDVQRGRFSGIQLDITAAAAKRGGVGVDIENELTSLISADELID